jgi:hypothetical protein
MNKGAGGLPASHSTSALPTPDTAPEPTAQFIKDEFANWAPIIRDADVKIS